MVTWLIVVARHASRGCRVVIRAAPSACARQTASGPSRARLPPPSRRHRLRHARRRSRPCGPWRRRSATPAGLPAGAGGGVAGWRVSVCAPSDVDRQPRGVVGWLRGRPETAEARPEVDGDASSHRCCGSPARTRRTGTSGRVTSSASASNARPGAGRSAQPWASAAGVDVEGQPGGRAERFVANHHARHPEVAHDEQVRGATQIEARVVDGASARLMKSSGTSQRLPMRAGAAGREISRPATDAMVWSGVSTIVRPLYPTVIAPPSSRTFSWNALARSSIATISWRAVGVMGMDRRPSRESTWRARGGRLTRRDARRQTSTRAGMRRARRKLWKMR